MRAKIFVDGGAGTTGLEIRERLARRSDLLLLQLAEAERKDARARAKALNEADLVILCLPDDAARDAVALIEKPLADRKIVFSIREAGAGTNGLTSPPSRATSLTIRELR